MAHLKNMESEKLAKTLSVRPVVTTNTNVGKFIQKH